MPTIEITKENFEIEIVTAPHPVLVDFWAPWCAPCRQLAPILEELSEEVEGHLKIAKIDTDAHPKLGRVFRIQSLPTMILMRGGKAQDVIQGALPKDQLMAKIKEWIPSLVGPEISAADLETVLKDGIPALIFDIRPDGQFARSHILGSKCVKEDDLEEKVEEAKNAPIILICRTGEESQKQAIALNKKGFPVRALVKGLLEWESDGYDTYSNKEEERLSL